MVLSLAQPRAPSYVLEHATDELNRLIVQARTFGDLTARLLYQAGL